jgi:hypothetical protein
LANALITSNVPWTGCLHPAGVRHVVVSMAIDGPASPKEHQDPPKEHPRSPSDPPRKIALYRMHVNQDPLQEIFIRYIAIFNHPTIYISFSSALTA